MGRINILRVSNFPTSYYNKAGYHVYKLADLEPIFYTYFVSAKLRGIPLNLNIEIGELRRFDFFLQEYSSIAGTVSKFIFLLRRILSIIVFSLKTIFFSIGKKIHIVHIHSPMYMLIAIWGKLTGKKVYISFHGEDFNRIKSSKVYKLIAKIFNGVFPISPVMVNPLKEIHGQEKIFEVYNGVDSEIFVNSNQKREDQIICVGSFKKVKGHRLIIDAFIEFLKVYPDYKLLLIGAGELQPELEEYCKPFQNIKFPGHLSTEKLVEVYNKSKILVLTSFSEGFPKVILEALSSGCIIAATKVGSIPKIFGNSYPFYFENRDAVLASKVLQKAVEQKELMNPYYSATKKYTWENVRSIYVEKYKLDLNVS